MIRIRKITSLIFISSLILLIQPRVFGQNSFEGIIELTTYNQEVDENAHIKWFVKQGNHKLEISGKTAEHSYTYDILLAAGDPNLKMIIEQNGQTLVYNVPPRVEDKNKAPAPEFIKTEETKSIAGYTCYKIKIINAESKTTCWVTNDINLSPDKFPDWLKSNPVYGDLVRNQVNGFPMQIETISSGGELLYSIKVEKLEATTLNSSEFELPASYIDGEEAIKESFEAR